MPLENGCGLFSRQGFPHLRQFKFTCCDIPYRLITFSSSISSSKLRNSGCDKRPNSFSWDGEMNGAVVEGPKHGKAKRKARTQSRTQINSQGASQSLIAGQDWQFPGVPFGADPYKVLAVLASASPRL